MRIERMLWWPVRRFINRVTWTLIVAYHHLSWQIQCCLKGIIPSCDNYAGIAVCPQECSELIVGVWTNNRKAIALPKWVSRYVLVRFVNAIYWPDEAFNMPPCHFWPGLSFGWIRFFFSISATNLHGCAGIGVQYGWYSLPDENFDIPVDKISVVGGRRVACQ